MNGQGEYTEAIKMAIMPQVGYRTACLPLTTLLVLKDAKKQAGLRAYSFVCFVCFIVSPTLTCIINGIHSLYEFSAEPMLSCPL